MTNSTPSGPSVNWDIWLPVGTVSALLVVAIALLWGKSAAPNSGFRDGAAVIALVTAAAVGIERLLEMMWTAVGMLAGSFWPLRAIGTQVQELADGLDEATTPVFERAEKALEAAKTSLNWTEDQMKRARDEHERLKKAVARGIADLKSKAPDSQRAQTLSAAVFQNINYLEKKYKAYDHKLTEASTAASQAVAGVADFVSTFKDNPGRRLISIYVGALLGVLVSGFLGLDVFAAALAPDPARAGEAAVALKGSTGGIIVTGILMGLGANPTHEVIRVLQEIKKSRKASNDPQPTLSSGSGSGGSTDLADMGAEGARSLAMFSPRRR